MTEINVEKVHKKRKRRLALGIMLVLGLCLYVFFAKIYPNLRKVIYAKGDLTESVYELNNPYCGWYEIFGYTLGKRGDKQAAKDIYKLDASCNLVLVEINLSQFADGDISEEALEELDGIFSAWSDASVQMIVRFAYDFDGNAKETEPKDISQVCAHMKQVIPYMNTYKKNIYICQGLFVGNWGEMHSSDYTNRADFGTLFSVLSHDLDSSIFLAVRTPEIWRQLTTSLTPIDEGMAYDGSLMSRLSLFNDGMLGSVTDVGTYDEDASFSDIVNFTGKGNRQEEISFQNQLCLYVPNGGEVIINNSYNDIESAVSALSEMRVSYLNMDYDEEVINKWKKSQYNGESGFNYIGKHLGYRYVLTDSDIYDLSFPTQKANYSITVKNEGFAPAYKKFVPSLVFVKSNTGEKKSVNISGDNRTWYPQEETVLSGTVDLSTYENGYYDVYFYLNNPDTNQKIEFANSSESNENGYYLGQMVITQR